jgi:hypothetical protein
LAASMQKLFSKPLPEAQFEHFLGSPLPSF